MTIIMLVPIAYIPAHVVLTRTLLYVWWMLGQAEIRACEDEKDWVPTLIKVSYEYEKGEGGSGVGKLWDDPASALTRYW